MAQSLTDSIQWAKIPSLLPLQIELTVACLNKLYAVIYQILYLLMLHYLREETQILPPIWERGTNNQQW
jgi:hypothetical protein